MHEIIVRVNGVNILKSSLEKPQILAGGQNLSLKDSITEELLFQKAAERKMMPTMAEVNKQISNFKTHSSLFYCAQYITNKNVASSYFY